VVSAGGDGWQRSCCFAAAWRGWRARVRAVALYRRGRALRPEKASLPSELLVCVVRCQRELGSNKWSAPGMLPSPPTLGPQHHLVDLTQSDCTRRRGSLVTWRRPPPLDLTSHTRNSRGILWCTGGVIGLRGQAPATTLPLCIIGPLTAYLDEKVWASVLKR